MAIDFTFADMHSHIIAGVDDGSRSLEMSLEMLRIASDEGIRRIILTPHNKIYLKSASPEGIIRRTDALQEECIKNNIDIKLYPGSELYYDQSLSDRLEKGQALSMAGTDHILIEFAPDSEYSYIAEAVRRLSYDGWKIILAHCERYICLYQKELIRVDDLLSKGVMLQVNAGDVLLGPFSKMGRFTRRLLSERKISFVGTDAHRDEGERAPYIRDCVNYIAKKYGEDYARLIVHDNTYALTGGE